MRNKVFIFIGGLLAGVIIGVLFSVAIKELLIQFKELHISLNRINLKQSQLSQRLDSIQGKLVPDAKKAGSNTVPNSSKPNTVNSSKAQVPNGNTKLADPVNSGNSANVPVTEDTDVVVMTNQLVSVLSVPLRINDTGKVNKKNLQTDSAIASMSEVGNSKEPLQYRVEFWKSPLNYKGYKMSRGKIILYGINPVTPVNITQQDDIYYLLVNQSAYRVEYTDDYKPFEKVTDKSILKKVGL
jgi:hypothetical protein